MSAFQMTVERDSNKYPIPNQMRRKDGTPKYAFVTFLMLNDSFLPGSLMLAYALRKQRTLADLLCMVTRDVSDQACLALAMLYDWVIRIPKIFVRHTSSQTRQAVPYMFTRLNALRLGAGGGLGYNYDKVVVLDSDVLPIKNYEHLFCINTPAGVINENKYHCIEVDSNNKYVVPEDININGTWCWHRIYDPICPHGQKIPKKITDRVKDDPSNMGINGSLFVLEPSLEEFERIMADIERPEMYELVGDRFAWPDMQYLTMRWSGQWTNVDLRFSSLHGYPRLSVLFGTHFAGIKPWNVNNKSIEYYGRFADFQYWYQEYHQMLTVDFPKLRGSGEG